MLSFTKEPKKLFIADGIGAVVSTFLLGFVLVKLEKYIGVPVSTLYLLAALPVFFAIYDFLCFKYVEKDVGHFLIGIAVINILYCCLSIGFAIHHYETITGLGWTYIIIEIIVVIVIAVIELKVGKQIETKK